MISDGKNTLLRIGVNKDVVECFKYCYEQFKAQPMEIVSDIQNVSVDEACQSIFQYIKSPARLIADGNGDCKSLTMFVASCLYCLHIPCIVRFVNFDGGSQYTHVYPVAIDERGKEIILDFCETTSGSEVSGTPIYDYARPYMKKQDIYYG